MAKAAAYQRDMGKLQKHFPIGRLITLPESHGGGQAIVTGHVCCQGTFTVTDLAVVYARGSNRLQKKLCAHCIRKANPKSCVPKMEKSY